MKSIYCIILSICILSITACNKGDTISTNCPIEKFGFYTINSNTNQLCFIDTLGNVVTIGGINFPQNNINYRSIEFDNAGNLWFLFNNILYSINTQNGTFQGTKTINYLPSTNTQVPLAFSFDSNNKLTIVNEATDMPPGTIYNVVNFAAGNANACPNSIGIPSILGIEYDGNNELWGIDECCSRKIHKIDATTGKALPNSFAYNLNGTPSDLDFSNGKMYGLSINPNRTEFFRIDLTNGSTKILFTLNGPYMGIAGAKRKI